MATFKDFDLQNAPLEGTTLIEASAGTGKSFSIAALFLRLVVEKAIPVHEILVVTFTEAATEELRDRIRKRLRDALGVLRGEPCKDEVLRRFLEAGESFGDAAGRLKEALGDFDRAAIMTIHGFCRRVLKENAFESSTPFEMELVTSQELLKREVVEDYWRKSLYSESPLFVRYALQSGFHPDSLLSLLGSRLSQPYLRIVPALGAVDVSAEERVFISSLESLRSAWCSAREEVSGILGSTEALKKTSYGKEKIPAWIEGMDLFLSCCSAELFPGFEKFTQSQIVRAVKKGCEPPAHPVFDLCEKVRQRQEELLAAYSRKMTHLKVELFRRVAEELTAKKRKRDILYFDDLLLNLLKALQGGAGRGLGRAVREKYKAALIDEFQDTDPIQYAIFQELFGSGEGILFLIGDPKQSIYGFRGADVFAYMEAARSIEHRFTLRENWRSDPGLIRAFNVLFENNPRPFVYESIQYHPCIPAPAASPPVLLVDGRPQPPFRLWTVEGDQPDFQWIPKSEARDLICRAVAGEIANLLHLAGQGRALLDGRPLREEEIAVLVRRNQEAARMQQFLSRLRIPSVLYGTGNLFTTHEAEEVERLLAAMAAPENGRLLRAALATDILGQKAEDLERLMTDERSWEEWLMRFRRSQDLWLSRGFIRMFRLFLRQERVLQRLMHFPDGERRCTNLLHLSELLHQASMERRLNPSGLLQWLSMQRSGVGTGEEHPMRLESDERAVRLITVHKSKGLEYPVVFCPFGWDGSELKHSRDPILFHAEETHSRLTLDLGSEAAEENRRHAEKEILSENLRLLYVSLTRAKARCTFVWGRFKSAESSAPAYLLYPPGQVRDEGIVEATKAHFLKVGDAFTTHLDHIARRAGGAIQVEPIPDRAGEFAPSQPPDEAPLSCRTFGGRIEREWGVASFSSLTSIHPRAEELNDRDQDAVPTGLARGGEETREFFSFPAGVRTGGFLHALFEELDFTEETPGIRSGLVREKLREYGFDAAWEDVVGAMLGRVLNAALDPDLPDLRLCRVRNEDRLNELEFYFPLKRVPAKRLQGILAGFGVEDGIPPDFAGRLGELVFSPTRGYMRGYIDLLFQHNGRSFLVDWKSHDLGSSVEDYGPRSLARAMKEGYYTLQALIYAVAVHQYLKLRLRGYRYDTHFGGILYIFVRGVDPARGPDYGISRTRPSEALIERLSAELIGG